MIFGPDHVLGQEALNNDKSSPFTLTTMAKYAESSIAIKIDINDAAHKLLGKFLCIFYFFSLFTLINFFALSPQATLAVLTKTRKTTMFQCHLF